MNPAPTLLSEWLTPTGFGVIVAVLLILAVIVVVAEKIRDRWAEAGRMIDAAPGPDDDLYARDVARYYCAGHGHQLRTFYSDVGGTTWVCVNCERSYWVPVADVPYDRENGVA